MHTRIVWFFLFLVPFFFTSCSVFDYPVRMLGFSVVKFENEKSGRFVKVLMMQKKDCFYKSISIISDFKAKITHKNFNKGYIIAFNFSKSFDCCLDSTEVGVFITQIDNSSVKIEIISNNNLLSQVLSTKFFEKIEFKN
ncbi:MAG: hypothetical protein LBC05_02770 [Endomicrobium sp.]|jgi:hypothetical protein|nr:hypothetical protein [Endomicrobium sp.]